MTDLRDVKGFGGILPDKKAPQLTNIKGFGGGGGALPKKKISEQAPKILQTSAWQSKNTDKHMLAQLLKAKAGLPQLNQQNVPTGLMGLLGNVPSTGQMNQTLEPWVYKSLLAKKLGSNNQQRNALPDKKAPQLTDIKGFGGALPTSGNTPIGALSNLLLPTVIGNEGANFITNLLEGIQTGDNRNQVDKWTGGEIASNEVIGPTESGNKENTGSFIDSAIKESLELQADTQKYLDWANQNLFKGPKEPEVETLIYDNWWDGGWGGGWGGGGGGYTPAKKWIDWFKSMYWNV